MKRLGVSELSGWLADGESPRPQIVDVREPWEVAIARLPGSVHIPMHEIPARWSELDPQRPVVCVCHHGMRSMQVGYFLERQGLDPVYNLAGGIDAWSREVDPDCPTY